jgi:hypothetical protein
VSYSHKNIKVIQMSKNRKYNITKGENMTSIKKLPKKTGTITKKPSDDKIEKALQEEGSKRVYGIQNSDVLESSLISASQALSGRSDNSHGFDLVLHSLVEMAPKDLIEARLCTQETVLYKTAMRYLTMAETALRSESDFSHIWQEAYMKVALKLLRLHNETAETLNKYRRGNEQKIVVQHQHVNVEGGGQAVIGQLHTKGGGHEKK